MKNNISINQNIIINFMNKNNQKLEIKNQKLKIKGLGIRITTNDDQKSS